MTVQGGWRPPPRGNAAQTVLFTFLGLTALGILLTILGFFAGVPLFYTFGTLFLIIGVLGAIVSGIVLLASSGSSAGSPPMPMGLPPMPTVSWQPGWYPDPQNPAMIRYFDGTNWTSSTQFRE